MQTTQPIALALSCALSALPAAAQLGEPEPVNSNELILLTADFDLDGVADVISTDVMGHGLTLSSRDALGEFNQRRVLVADGRDLMRVSAADADADGDLDIFALDRTTLEVLVYPNSGAGPLGTPTILPAAATSAGNYVLADLDQDGDLDVITGGYVETLLNQTTNGASLHENLGGLAFAAPTVLIPATTQVYELVGADVDDDGDTDLLGTILTASLDRATLFRNDPGSQLTQLDLGRAVSGRSSAQAADLDGDGITDIVLIGGGPVNDTILMAKGLGSGSFAPPIEIIDLGGQSNLLTLDADGDGDPDLVTLQRSFFTIPSITSLLIHENVGGGSFAVGQSVQLEALSAETLDKGVADLDGNGAVDLLFTERTLTGERTSLLKMRGAAGPFGTESITTPGSTLAGIRTVVSEDANGDGEEELIGVSVLGTGPQLLGDAGPSILGEPVLYEVADLDEVTWVDIRDYDGDGQPETLALAGPGQTLYSIDGAGSGAGTAVVLGSTGSTPRIPKLGDIDGDGDLDLLWASPSSSFDVFENLGNGAWAGPTPGITAPGLIFSVDPIVEDLNGDGLVDLACTYYPGFFAPLTVGVSYRQPDGTLPAPQPLNLGPLASSQPTDITLGDNDGDGDLDIYFASEFGTVGLVENLGGGSFAQAVSIIGGLTSLRQIESIELDPTPGPELLVRNQSGIVEAYFQAPATSIWVLMDVVEVSGVDGMQLVDRGRDGDLDLVLTDSVSGLAYLVDNEFRGEVGTTYCGPATLNSTGQTGKLVAVGSDVASANALELRASDLPIQSFGFFLASRAQDDVFPVTGSVGRLCLGGSIGRYVGPGQIQQSDLNGQFSLALDLTQIPQPNGPEAAMAGDVWNFQAWHRDVVLFSVRSNFTEAVSVTLQ